MTASEARKYTDDGFYGSIELGFVLNKILLSAKRREKYCFCTVPSQYVLNELINLEYNLTRVENMEDYFTIREFNDEYIDRLPINLYKISWQ